MPNSIPNKRTTHLLHNNNNSPPKKAHKSSLIYTAYTYIQTLDLPLISSSTKNPLNSIILHPNKPYTIGRTLHLCDSVFHDKRVSKQHFQILFDPNTRKLLVSDGLFWDNCYGLSRVRVSLNGVFVNGVRVEKGGVLELGAGDEVALVCADGRVCELGFRIGFVVRKIAFFEEVFDRKGDFFWGNRVPLEISKDCLELNSIDRKNDFFEKVFDRKCDFWGENRVLFESSKNCLELSLIHKKDGFFEKGCDRKSGFLGKNRVPFESSKDCLELSLIDKKDDFLGGNSRYFNFESEGCKDSLKMNVLLGQCRKILDSDDPLCCIRKCISSSNGLCPELGIVDSSFKGNYELKKGTSEAEKVELSSVIRHREKKVKALCVNVDTNYSREFDCVKSLEKNVLVDAIEIIDLDPVDIEKGCESRKGIDNTKSGVLLPSPGNKFYLNRLQTISIGSPGYHDSVSLPELLYPVENLKQIFIATFTSDIPWFLSYCEIPFHIPITIACHNRDRCWSSNPDERFSRPYSDFPHLVVVYPPFPEAIAFSNDKKNLGIACHHPKLFVLQREDSIRVVITSANLVSKQWNDVTNTVWWQDFPRASSRDCFSLFTQICGEQNQNLVSDFAAQLAGFMATLVSDVPNQAHWIIELTKYDFKGAKGHLVASVPGIHSRRESSVFESLYFSSSKQCASRADIVKSLGSIETFVVGLSHLFRSSADSNGAQLKKLAAFIQNYHKNSNGMLEVLLKRNTHIPADTNAVSVFVPNPKEFSVEDCVQIGFLPRHVAKWVAPLLDSGLFRFCGYVYPKQVLATALEGSTSKVHMLLYVSQGPSFSDIAGEEYIGYYPAICTLIASIQRSTGIWRLNEVLSRYKWPENLETDFVFGSSSIGAVNAQFLAAFSAAVGKTSVQVAESEESDPEWGCWSASQELINPSIRIIFPTIERVKNASCGILASKRMLCFSQKTWYRLRNVDILHDAIPFPNDRLNHPMHVKVARRRFNSKTNASSFGWVYCGSHNFSAAAWGRPLCNSTKTMGDKPVKSNSILGSRLHISNYEIGIIFIVPPSDTNTKNLDDIVMPFVVPAPKYRHFDRPATPQAMREAYAEVIRLQERETLTEDVLGEECLEEDIPDEEEEILERNNYIVEEKADEKAYADALWSQVDSSQSC